MHNAQCTMHKGLRQLNDLVVIVMVLCGLFVSLTKVIRSMLDFISSLWQFDCKDTFFLAISVRFIAFFACPSATRHRKSDKSAVF